MGLTKESAGKRKRIDAWCAELRLKGEMSGKPEPVEFRALAAAVFNRAFEDLDDPNEREDAEDFLRFTAWEPGVPFARALELNRQEVIAKVDAILERLAFARRAFA
jgi:hypothetical protein